MEHKDYQYEGVRWCLQNELRVASSDQDDNPLFRGGFVADEMGLGKTIMMIGLFLSHFRSSTLVVVPLVLLDQWYAQIYKTTGHKALIYHGPERWNESIDTLRRAPVVLTTYDMIALPTPKSKKRKQGNLPKKKRESTLHQIVWNRVVFDEGHHLRNRNTGKYLGAKSLRAEIRWLVSGTPIQNKKQDFTHLCEVIGMPASFYTSSSDKVTMTAHHYLLKRTKKQVGIQIADLHWNRASVPWNNPHERELSLMIHSYLPFTHTVSENLPPSKIMERGLHRMKILGEKIPSPLLLLLRARQSCILPRMMFPAYSGLRKGNETIKEALVSTSKMDYVVECLLKKKENGNGKLVFCHFREEMDELASRLRSGGLEKIHLLDGRMSLSKRKMILGSSSGCDVLIMQIQTCCEGLNLQEHYNEIYFVSPHWNPSIEDQAVARCHRIGQQQQVEVFRFIMDTFDSEAKTIENYVQFVQENKRKMINEILHE
jgi:SNF2 family DNA or RNA helicase